MSSEPESQKAALDRALHHATEYLESMETRSVVTAATHEELTERLDIELQDGSLATEQVIDELAARDGDHDRRTDEVIDRIQAKGVTWFGGSNWRGTRVMRVSVLNWRTSERDVSGAMEPVRQVLEELDG